jgi:hypothetical protein
MVICELYYMGAAEKSREDLRFIGRDSENSLIVVAENS